MIQRYAHVAKPAGKSLQKTVSKRIQINKSGRKKEKKNV